MGLREAFWVLFVYQELRTMMLMKYKGGSTMANYETKDIRNVALMGHGSEGKTTLMEALLYAAGVTDRQGKVDDGTTVTDFDPEETKRHISISAAIAPIDWNQKMLNVIDVPGYFDFVGEMMGPLRVVETAAILVNAVGGVAVGPLEQPHVGEPGDDVDESCLVLHPLQSARSRPT